VTVYWLTDGSELAVMMYNQIREEVAVQYGPPNYPSETTAGASLAAVAVSYDSHWYFAADHRPHLVICTGLYQQISVLSASDVYSPIDII